MKLKAITEISNIVNGEDCGGPYRKGREFEVSAKWATLFIGSKMAVEVKAPKKVAKKKAVKSKPASKAS